jgi:hypothetical protein
MSDTQLLTIALAAAPTMLTVLVGILINNARLNDLRVHIDSQFKDVDRRFDEMRDPCRSELRRVEEVLDGERRFQEQFDKVTEQYSQH